MKSKRVGQKYYSIKCNLYLSYFLIYASTLFLNFYSFSAKATEWESLGSSEAILKKAKAIDANNKVRVVQKRSVERDLRFEISGHYGFINGGDSYVKTQTGGLQLEFHVNPKFSLGLRYNTYFNGLTSEGERIYNDAEKSILNGNQAQLPEIDYPLNSQLATVSWYPIYGKLNFFDEAITQFDLYLMAGAGSVKLETAKNATLLSAGTGVGIWFSQHIMARGELRYQGYKDTAYSKNQQVNTMALQFSLGLLL